MRKRSFSVGVPRSRMRDDTEWSVGLASGLQEGDTGREEGPSWKGGPMLTLESPGGTQPKVQSRRALCKVSTILCVSFGASGGTGRLTQPADADGAGQHRSRRSFPVFFLCF